MRYWRTKISFFFLINARFLRPWLEKTLMLNHNDSIAMSTHWNNIHDPPCGTGIENMVNQPLPLADSVNFSYSRTLFVTPKSIPPALLWSFVDMHRETKKCELPDVRISSWGWTAPLLPCFSSQTVNKRPLHSLFSAMFFPYLYFLLLISLFKMALV